MGGKSIEANFFIAWNKLKWTKETFPSLKNPSIFSPDGETRKKRARESLIVFATRRSLWSSHATHYNTRRRARKCNRSVRQKKKRRTRQYARRGKIHTCEVKEKFDSAASRSRRVLELTQVTSKSRDALNDAGPSGNVLQDFRQKSLNRKLSEFSLDENSPGLDCFARSWTSRKKRKEASRV